MKFTTLKSTMALLLFGATTMTHAADIKIDDKTTLSVGGFIKVNASWSDFEFGSRASNDNDLEDDLLFPSRIAVSGEADDVIFNADAETTRLFIKSKTETDVGTIKSHLEIDFLSEEGNEIITNSANGRLRHGYVAWDYSDNASILVGQTWSTFFNVGALPEAVDFIGPTSGVIFSRQPVVRWTQKFANGGSFQLAAENPSSSLSGLPSDNGAGSDIDDSSVPDIVARYNGKSGQFNWSLAVVGRDIAFDNGTLDGSEYGFASSFSGKYVFANGNDIKFMVSSGNLGRYIALIPFRDGYIDSATGDIDLTSVTGGFVAYRHHWNKHWRSTAMYAISNADLANGISDTATSQVSNYNINLIYSPYKKLSFGVEWIGATRELENGDSGDLNRLQFTAKYSF